MTDKSQLENLKDVQLFYLLKSVGNQHHSGIEDIVIDRNIMEDSRFHDSCDSAGRLMGLDMEYPTDYNYIAATIKLNPDYDFDTNRPSGPLRRPKGNVYSYEISEFRIEHVRRDYRHEIISYSKDLIISTVESMLSEGSLDIYEGLETGEDNYDGETVDEKIDKDSIRLIK